MSSQMWDLYFKNLLLLFIAEGDDGNHTSAVTCNLAILQALARRIHYGKFVAEAKFKGAPDDYESAIRSRENNALMTPLTDEKEEEMAKQRVAKKAIVFGQDVTQNDTNSGDDKYKMEPAVVSRLYDEWVIPPTKVVEVEYLLCRLD